MENRIEIIELDSKGIPLGTFNVDYIKCLGDRRFEIKLSEDPKMTFKEFADKYFPLGKVDVKAVGECWVFFHRVYLEGTDRYLCGWEYYDWKQTFILTCLDYRVL